MSTTTPNPGGNTMNAPRQLATFSITGILAGTIYVDTAPEGGATVTFRPSDPKNENWMLPGMVAHEMRYDTVCDAMADAVRFAGWDVLLADDTAAA